MFLFLFTTHYLTLINQDKELDSKVFMSQIEQNTSLMCCVWYCWNQQSSILSDLCSAFSLFDSWHSFSSQTSFYLRRQSLPAGDLFLAALPPLPLAADTTRARGYDYVGVKLPRSVKTKAPASHYNVEVLRKSILHAWIDAVVLNLFTCPWQILFEKRLFPFISPINTL